MIGPGGARYEAEWADVLAADRLAELAALADAATSGPWVVQDGDEVHAPHLLDQEEASDVATIFDADADAAFIAASREAVPALIAALRAVLAHAEHHIAIADGHDHHRPCEAKARRAFARVLIAEINAALGVTT